MKNIAYDFGQNWKDFSNNALEVVNIEQSLSDFKNLIDHEDIKNKTFIDIGFGQGLNLLNASLLGADTLGCDINPKCKEVLEFNQKKYPNIGDKKIPVIVGSILDIETINSIKKYRENFDIVHSWGVLHHTGKMWKAIDIACSLVNKNGKLIISIYNKHWSSPLWRLIKLFYNIAPKFIKWIMIKIFYVVIFMAKFLVTFKNPLKKKRGMNFYYDIIDWLGGYPYEYANIKEITDYIEKMNFKTIKVKAAQVPTACNEYIFERTE